MLLNKTALKNKRLKLAVADYILKIIHILDHSSHLFGVVVLGAEILGDAVFKCLSFTDIYYLFVFVVHYINSGRKRQSHSFFAEFGDFFVHSVNLVVSD